MSTAAVTTVEDVEGRLQTLYAAEQAGGPAKIDPATIAMILQILMSVIGGCTKQRSPKEIADYARNPP